MSFSSLEKKIFNLIEPQIAGATPGLVLQVHSAGRKICDISVGETYPYYDLASLTKIIFTVQALMWAFDQDKWKLEAKVSDYLDWFPQKNVKIVELLNHSSGMLWWSPFYEKIKDTQSRSEKWQQVLQLVRELPLAPQDTSVYSDVGFITLGAVLEKIYDKPLLEVWQLLKENFYPRLTLDFHEDNVPKNPSKYYAPTERCRWRNRILQGEVHDENAWSLGGVSSHAGLFGSVDDVSWYGLLLRSQWLGVSKTLIRKKTTELFTMRSRPMGKGDWALGFMLPTKGSSSSGTYFSPLSVGHTGFTGTSLWYDPNLDLLVVLLSNRVFFGRETKNFASLRPQVHNWIVESLRRV